MPGSARSASLESLSDRSEGQRSALAFAQVYADEFDKVLRIGRSALFVGKPGTGKTHLACGIGLQIMREQNRTVLFSTVMRAIRRVKDSWGRDSRQTESQAIETLVAPDLLILDEVGVLNERYEKRRPTILMSNLAVSDVTGYLGERIIDRIREDGGGLIVFDWESHRAKGGAA